MRRFRYILFGGAAVLVAMAAVACSTDVTPLESRVGVVEDRVAKLVPSKGVKQFFLTGVEWKGTTSADELAAPSVDPKTLSEGYGFKGPGILDPSNPEKWQVATYTWTPGSMVAYQGDTVELTAFIVNGDHHNVRLVAPDGTEIEAMEMNRGREYKLAFEASRAGIYRLVCDTHAPTMTANITVLPTS